MANPEIEFYKSVVKREFGILKKWTNTEAMTYDEAYKNLITLISKYIKDLMENDYNKLMEILYRTDISEKKAREVFAQNDANTSIASGIATLFMERLYQKWETKKAYRDDDFSGEWLDV